MANHKCAQGFCKEDAITHIEIDKIEDKWLCHPHFLSFIGFLTMEALKHKTFNKYVKSGMHLAADPDIEKIKKELAHER